MELMHNLNRMHQNDHPPQLYAHRGSTVLAPENTIAAFDLALGYECDVLEIDVRLSKDNVVMVTHDVTLERTTDGTGFVRDFTQAELQALNAAAQFTDLEGKPYRGPSQQLLTLEEMLQRYPTIGINIDIKDPEREAAEAVASVLNSVSHNQWINVGSFHAPVLRYFRQLAPNKKLHKWFSEASNRTRLTSTCKYPYNIGE